MKLVLSVILALAMSIARAESVPILTFHRVTDDRAPGPTVVSPSQFSAYIEALKAQGLKALKIEELVQLMKSSTPIPPKLVCITFDDGWRDQLTAAQILEKQKFPATFYVLSGTFDDPQYFSKDQLRSLAQNPLFEIGGHSHTHFPEYTVTGKITSPAMIGELVMSRTFIEEVTKTQVKNYAWPYGFATTEAVQFAERLGFSSTAMVNSISKNTNGRTLELQRMNIDGRCSVQSVLKMVRTGVLEAC
jgi:peptidoglycan/xylan/chitin deacetylase (PgdA/CDA1 family)